MDVSVKENRFVLTVKEAAEYLRLSEMTIKRLAQQGFIPGAKIGRKWRFSRDAVAGLLRNPEILRHVEMRRV